MKGDEEGEETGGVGGTVIGGEGCRFASGSGNGNVTHLMYVPVGNGLRAIPRGTHSTGAVAVGCP